MSIVSIGEVIGNVQGGPSEPEPLRAADTGKEEQAAASLSSQLEAMEREHRAKARREARLRAD